ncbi:MAG: hypothetical protein EI684_20125, partial [Candidatus Viridilinea halotolerans]
MTPRPLAHTLLTLSLLFAVVSVGMLTPAPLRAAPGDTTRVSVASDGTQANGASGAAAVSADGRYVAFMSEA